MFAADLRQQLDPRKSRKQLTRAGRTKKSLKNGKYQIAGVVQRVWRNSGVNVLTALFISLV